MNRNCPRCQAAAEAQDKYCGACGFNLTANAALAAGTQVEMKMSDIHLNLGVVYYKNGKYAKSVEMFEKILEQEPNHQEAIEMLEKARMALSEATAGL